MDVTCGPFECRAIAGRNSTHLAAVAESLAAAGGPSSSPAIIVAPLTVDPSPWVMRAHAVITAAGPFSVHGGEALVKACVQTGTHYADTSDEFYWQRRMIDRYDAGARSSGARIVLAAGFCVLAADLGAALALAPYRGLAQPVQLDAWLERYNGGVSAGVIHTVGVNASYPPSWADAPYVLAESITPAAQRLDTLVDGTTYPIEVEGEGRIAQSLFGDYDARLVRRSIALRNERSLAHGTPQAVRLRVGATPAQWEAWAAFLLEHPRSWGSLTSCPTPQLLAGGSWRYKFAASVPGRADDAGRANLTAVLSGRGDPGYAFTSSGLAEIGLCLGGHPAAGGARCLGGGGGGVMTPSIATNISVLVERLEARGLLTVDWIDEAIVEQDSGPSADEALLAVMRQLATQ